MVVIRGATQDYYSAARRQYRNRQYMDGHGIPSDSVNETQSTEAFHQGINSSTLLTF